MSWVIKSAQPFVPIWETPTRPQPGDRVRMTQAGIARWGDQAGGGEGKVVAVHEPSSFEGRRSFELTVRWDRGSLCLYTFDQVEVV